MGLLEKLRWAYVCWEAVLEQSKYGGKYQCESGILWIPIALGISNGRASDWGQVIKVHMYANIYYGYSKKYYHMFKYDTSA